MAEVELGKLVHAVAVHPTFQHIGNQHGVVIRRDVDAVAMQDRQVVLDVLPDLKDVAVFQKRFQRRDRLTHRYLLQARPITEIEAF